MEGLVENATPYMMSWDTLRSLCVVEGIKPSRRRKSRMINALRKVDKLPSGFDAWCSHQQEEEAEEESEEEQEKAGDEEMAEEEEGEQENSGDEQKASSSSSHSSSSSCDSLDSSAASSQAESVESVESAEEGLRRTMLKAVGVKRRARTRSARRTNTAKTSFLTDPGTVGQGPRKLLELELGSQIIREGMICESREAVELVVAERFEASGKFLSFKGKKLTKRFDRFAVSCSCGKEDCGTVVFNLAVLEPGGWVCSQANSFLCAGPTVPTRFTGTTAYAVDMLAEVVRPSVVQDPKMSAAAIASVHMLCRSFCS
jgi:hypothetical protein